MSTPVVITPSEATISTTKGCPHGCTGSCNHEPQFESSGRTFEGQSFELANIKWGDPQQGTSGGVVTWSFATANRSGQSSGVDFATPMPSFFVQLVRDAFDAWEAVADIDFVEVEDSNAVNIRVGLGTLDGPGQPGQTNTVGTAFFSFFDDGTFEKAFVVMDVADYTSVSDSQEFYLTTLHEIGHAIGFNHEDDVPSIMSTLINNSITGLTADDIEGAQTLYGPSTTPIVDDFTPDGTGTNGTLLAGGDVSGNIEIAGDQDWFSITLTAGREYQFDAQGTSLSDVFMEVRDSSGTLVASDDDSGAGLNARITFTPTTSGTYFVVASAVGSVTGTYSVAAQDLGVPTAILPGITVSEGTSDAPGTTATTDALISGDTFSGELSSAADKDFVSITLTAGTQYTFDLQGAGAGTGTLADPFLVLRDANGNFAAQDDNSGPGDDARIVFTPDSTGTYYLSARTFGESGGTYALATSPGERTEGGETATPDPTPDPDPGPTVPGITVAEGGTDAGADITTLAEFISGDTFDGNLESGADKDWVRVILTSDTEYTFDLKGAGSGEGTLPDGFLVLRDADGNFIAQDDNSGVGTDARVVYTPNESGVFYISARTFTGEGGDYLLTSSPNERTEPGSDPTPDPTPGQTVQEGSTDVAGDTSSDAVFSVGDTFQGELDATTDRDFVGIELSAGTSYTFDLKGSASDAGTLPDPFLVLRDATGTFVAQDDNSGTGLDSRIAFTPSASGTYFLDVRRFDGDAGTYELTATSGSAAQSAQVAAASSDGYSISANDALDALSRLVDEGSIGV